MRVFTAVRRPLAIAAITAVIAGCAAVRADDQGQRSGSFCSFPHLQEPSAQATADLQLLGYLPAAVPLEQIAREDRLSALRCFSRDNLCVAGQQQPAFRDDQGSVEGMLAAATRGEYLPRKSHCAAYDQALRRAQRGPIESGQQWPGDTASGGPIQFPGDPAPLPPVGGALPPGTALPNGGWPETAYPGEGRAGGSAAPPSDAPPYETVLIDPTLPPDGGGGGGAPIPPEAAPLPPSAPQVRFQVDRLVCKRPFEAYLIAFDVGEPDSATARAREKMIVWHNIRREGRSDAGWLCAPARRFCYGAIEPSEFQTATEPALGAAVDLASAETVVGLDALLAVTEAKAKAQCGY